MRSQTVRSSVPLQHGHPAWAGLAGGAERSFLSHQHVRDLDYVSLKSSNNLGKMWDNRASDAGAERSQQA